MGAPENEYDMEIMMITNRIKNTSGVKEIAIIIYEVLIEMFNEETFNNINKLKEGCYSVAEMIYTNLNHK